MEVNPEEMMPLPIEDLVSGVKSPCDLYVRLSESKFVLVANAGTTTQVDQLANFQSKAVEYLWVFKREYYKVVHHTTSIAGIILNRKDVSDAKKTNLLSKAAVTVFRQIDSLGLDLNSYGTAKQVSEAIIAFAENHDRLSGLIESLKKSSDYMLSHSLAVSTLSAMIGQEVGYEKKATLERLALGGLLHDIGLKALPPELALKSVLDMTAEEILKWETHAFKGMQMLQAIGIVPDDVVSMVYEHHENSIGQGFPQQIRDVKLHPLGKVVALADQFAELTLPGPNSPNPKSAREALVYIDMTMGLPYNKEAFRALRRVVEKDKQAA